MRRIEDSGRRITSSNKTKWSETNQIFKIILLQEKISSLWKLYDKLAYSR